MVLSEKVAAIAPSLTLSITAKAKQMKQEGISVIGFGAGEPDFNTPDYIIESAKHALDIGFTKYTPASGMPELKEAIVRKFKEDNGLTYAPGQIVVSCGAKSSLYHAIASLLNDGDEVLIPSPYWLTYPELVRLAGGVSVFVPAKKERDYKVTAEDLARHTTAKTKLLILNSPNNPTGAVMSAAEVEEIAAVLRETNVLVLSDEIYSELTYGLDRHVSIASLPGMAERTIVVNGFSKSYAMTGWRLGYAVGPAPLIKVMTKIHQSCIMSAPTTSQYAAITALRQCDDQIEMMRDEYNRRRRYVVKALNEMGLTCFEPRGAFYVFPSIQISGLTSSEFCEQLLREKEVAIIPGSAFGASGEGYARISYAYSVDHLQTAMKRIREFLKEHGWIQK